jgi:predicted O-methyltransferase YrrM
MAPLYNDTKTNKETNHQLVSLRRYAKKHNVPIITEEGSDFLRQLVILKNPKSILEIGTAIGYTSIQLCKNSSSGITTIERDIDMAIIAKEEIEKSGCIDRIHLIVDDALFVDAKQLGPFDLIFIDAAKAQNQHLFDKYKKRLNPEGVIVVDNLSFHGITVDTSKSRQLKAMVRKIEEFKNYLLKQNEFDTVIYQIGDGMSVSVKRSD